MKVITIKQPWASLIINGYKKYEFRTWKTKYRGELYIHAAKSYDKKALERFKDLNIDFPLGKIIGKVNVVDCLLITNEFNEKIIEENPLVYGYHKERKGYAFVLERPLKLAKMYEVKGKLSIWNYDEDIGA